MATAFRVQADYLVVGAGAAGMAFVDALVDHAEVRVAMVDRRDGPGGHWRAAYPFVRLHQASSFYGVASTVLGGGRVQTDGPEAGLQVRADQPAICAYYDGVLERLHGQCRWSPGRATLPRSARDTRHRWGGGVSTCTACSGAAKAVRPCWALGGKGVGSFSRTACRRASGPPLHQFETLLAADG